MSATHQPFVLIDDARTGGGGLLFERPGDIIACTRADGVDEALSAIDAALANGKWIAGFFAYELGYALEPRLAPLMPERLNAPLIWLGVFDAPQVLDKPALKALMTDWAQEPASVELGAPEIAREDYLAQVERIRAHIEAGDVYQINYTFHQPVTVRGNPLALYARLRTSQRAAYGAMLATGERHVLSLSPELFFESDGETIRTCPMKGTAARAADPAQDQAIARDLSEDEKSRAENLMIVDLLRNDVSRVSEPGSVRVDGLFEVETYPTVHQMISTIAARLKSGTAFSDMLCALFPCGSVTGAPKVKAMELIHALERSPRGIYTGAVGYCGPGGKGAFNVAIRTLDINAKGQGALGIGSGVVYDSEPEAEWDECHVKARFLASPPPDFELLETLRWDRENGFALLDRHMARISATAEYFGYPLDEAQIRKALQANVTNTAHDALRLRLTVDAWGEAKVETAPLSTPPGPLVWRYALAEPRVDTQSPFTFHKTTLRAFYDQERERLSTETGCDEVLFLNVRGELTEGSFTNVFIEKNGELLTPPVSCGLLAGTLRAELIESGRAREAVLTPDDLNAPNRVFFGNSVRGLIEAQSIENIT